MPNIIPTMKRLGYSPVEGGMCFGIASMGAHAVIRKEIHSFYNRVLRIHNLTEEKLISIIKERQSKSVDDLYYFFDGVAIYQGGNAIPHAIKKALYSFTRADSIERKLIFKGSGTSTEIANEKLAFADIKKTLVCPMTTRKLVDFVNELKSSLKDHSFSLMIHSMKFTHTTQLGFDGDYWLAVDHDIVNVFKDKETSIDSIIPNVVPDYFESENDIVNLSIDILLSEQSSVDLSWVNKYELNNANMSTLIKDAKSFIDFINQCCYSNQHEKIRHLSKYINNSLINVMIENQSSPLIYAAIMGNTAIVETLLDTFNEIPLTTDQYVKLFAVSNDGFATLSTAALKGHADIVKLLLEKTPLTFDQFAESDNLIPALYSAAQEGHADIVKLLIESMQKSGLPINKQISLLQATRQQLNLFNNSIYKTPALTMAAQNGFSVIVKLLLEGFKKFQLTADQYSEQLNVKNECNATALYLAASDAHVETVKKLTDAIKRLPLLQKQRFEILNSKNNENNDITPFFISVLNGHTAIVERLIKVFSDAQLNPQQLAALLSARVKTGESALYIAVQNGHNNIVKAILKAIKEMPLTTEQRIELLKAENHGNSALFLAASKGYAEIFEALIHTIITIPMTKEQQLELLEARGSTGESRLSFISFCAQRMLGTNFFEYFIKLCCYFNQYEKIGYLSKHINADQEGHADLGLLTQKRLTLLEAKDPNSISASEAAATKGNTEIVNMLTVAFSRMKLTTE